MGHIIFWFVLSKTAQRHSYSAFVTTSLKTGLVIQSLDQTVSYWNGLWLKIFYRICFMLS